MKKIALFLLASAGVFAGAALGKTPLNIDDAHYFDENNVVLSFGAVTDVHNNANYPKYRKALANTIDYLVELNDTDPLDALLIGGDLVDTTWETTGTDLVDFHEFSDGMHEKINPTDTALFYCLGNHDADPTGARGIDAMNVGKYYFNILGKEYFQHDEDYESMYDHSTGLATDFVTNNRSMVLNGFHFIAITPKYFWNSKGGFDETSLAWLTAKLDEAVQDDPTKPIFVISHAAIANTTRESENEYWAYADLSEYLSNYPQVIYMSGHIHNIISDEKSIEQDKFTIVDLGSTKNSGTFNDYMAANYKWNNYTGVYSYDNSIGSIDVSSGCYFQVDNKGNVKISRVVICDQFGLKGELEPWYIDAPKADGSHLVRYNSDYRRALNAAPYFEENSVFITQQKGSNIFATLSAAKDDEYVEYYQFSLKTQYEELIWEKHFQTLYFKEVVSGFTSPNPIYDIGAISPGKYILEVRAGDVWHSLSEPMVTTLIVQ